MNYRSRTEAYYLCYVYCLMLRYFYFIHWRPPTYSMRETHIIYVKAFNGNYSNCMLFTKSIHGSNFNLYLL